RRRHHQGDTSLHDDARRAQARHRARDEPHARMLSQQSSVAAGISVRRRLAADKPAGIDAEYWALAKCNGGWRVEWAFASMRHDWARFAKSLFGDASSQETIAFHDIE